MTPLLLLHGAMGSEAQFQALLPHLPPDWPVFTLNFPGHGGRSTKEPYSMALFTEAVLDFMNAHQFSGVNIFGYSMGGYVALHLAGEYPERLRRLVTLGTKQDWSPEVAVGIGRMFDPEKIAAKVPQFARALSAAHAPADWQLVCQRTTDFLNELGAAGGLPADSLARITCPVTIAWGDQDNVVSADESQRVAGQIEGAKFQVLEGFKHPMEQVDPRTLATFLIAEFSAPEK